MTYQQHIKKEQQRAKAIIRRMERQTKARVRAHVNNTPHACPLEGRAT